VRKASLKLTLTSGILFGIALLTKLFAVFTLIPLALFFVYYRPRSLKQILASVGLFVLPGFLMYCSWYELISRLGFFSVLTHNDFSSSIAGVTPSLFFLFKFFIDNPGLLLVLAVGVSVGLSLWKSKLFGKTAIFDLMFLAAILGIAGVNMYLVLARGLSVPYVDPVKYDYQALPAFCLLAASLMDKTRLLLPKFRGEPNKSKISFVVAVIGVILLVSSVAVNMLTLSNLIGKDHLVFKVEGDVGFSFERLSPTIGQQYLFAVQVLGFVVVGLSLLWANKEIFSRNS
jgi:4-amino-4-deoxy-L-arabinose transferase-like glycosyltransferase